LIRFGGTNDFDGRADPSAWDENVSAVAGGLHLSVHDFVAFDLVPVHQWSINVVET
jgi:hypothetical protein